MNLCVVSIELSLFGVGVVVLCLDGWLLYMNYFFDYVLSGGECMFDSLIMCECFVYLNVVVVGMMGVDVCECVVVMCGVVGDVVVVCFYLDWLMFDIECWEMLLIVGIDIDVCVFDYVVGNLYDFVCDGFMWF